MPYITIPFDRRIFQVDFDFEQHKLFIDCTNEKIISIDPKPMTVADLVIINIEIP